uniref:Major facilitator superfamily (MFS) profile domain-containing protein n=1 Tax=Clastoptera arizonana TaxID=38151 RepID=A0A1B6D9S0_9HEMI
MVHCYLYSCANIDKFLRVLRIKKFQSRCSAVMAVDRMFWSRAWRSVTVEPVVILYFISVGISAFIGSNLVIQKACHPNMTSEPDYSLPCPDEAVVQNTITQINTWKPLLESVTPLMFVIFLGTWSDTHGKRRKPLIIIPMVGELIRLLSFMWCTYYWQVNPEVTTLIEATIKGLSGGMTSFMFGTNTYITDITTVEERTFRLGVLSAMSFIGSPLGVIMGGILRKTVGFLYAFMVCFVLVLVALYVAVVGVKNTASVETKLKTFEGMFDPSHFIGAVKTVFKKRPQNRRLILFLTASIAPLFLASFIGEYSVLYFFMRYKFHMGEVEYGNYCAYKMIVIFIGTFVSLIICTKILKMSDAIIGCLATVTQIASAVGMCFAVEKWQMYVFPVVDLMHGASNTASRSIITKIVDGNELGQVFGVIGAVDVFVPIVTFPVYNLVYKNTLLFMPGAFYFVSVFLTSIVFMLFLITYIVQRRMIRLANEQVITKDKREKVVYPLI